MKSPKLLFFFLLLSLGASGQGLFDDAQFRQRIALSYRPDNNWVINGKYYLLMDQQMSHFASSTLGLEVNYKLYKWLRLGGEYRFETSNIRDRNRFYLFAIADKGYKKWNGSWRAMYQDDFVHFDAEYLSVHPAEKRLRNLLTLSYDYNRKIGFFASTELYHHLNAGDVGFFRQSFTVGGSYLFKRRHQFGLDLSWYHQPGSTTNRNYSRTTVSYTMVIGKKKGPKKKKNKKDGDNTTVQPVPDTRD